MYKNIEAYKHRFAKEVLREWLSSEYTVELERPFYIDGRISFVPDVTCSVDGAVISFYEIVNKHPINGKKLGRIQSWCYRNSTPIDVYEVDSNYIMAQIEKPRIISTINEYYINEIETTI